MGGDFHGVWSRGLGATFEGLSPIRELGYAGGSYRRGINVRGLDFDIERFDRLAGLIDLMF